MALAARMGSPPLATKDVMRRERSKFALEPAVGSRFGALLRLSLRSARKRRDGCWEKQSLIFFAP